MRKNCPCFFLTQRHSGFSCCTCYVFTQIMASWIFHVLATAESGSRASALASARRRKPGSPYAAAVTCELLLCGQKLKGPHVGKHPRMFLCSQMYCSAEVNGILARYPLLAASVCRQGDTPATSQSTPKGLPLQVPGRGGSQCQSG